MKVKVEDVETQFQPIWIVVKRTVPIFTERVLSCIMHDPPFSMDYLKGKRYLFSMIFGVLPGKRLEHVTNEGCNWLIYMETKKEFIWCIVTSNPYNHEVPLLNIKYKTKEINVFSRNVSTFTF